MRSTLPVVLALLLVLSAILAVSGAATIQTHVLRSTGNSPTNNISNPNSNGSQSQIKLTPQPASAGQACAADDCQQDT
ncbi:MAG TPA: hypothetical protein VE862_02050, partial [Candidatus Acidoferrum sp.]|nr:hypothetical protein [Candidatus Acidoferrum sp.]